MSNNLTAGGAPSQLVRDTGSPGAVQGFVTDTITQGPRLAAGLTTLFVFQLAEASMQIGIVAAAKQLWIKIAGVWKQATPWIKIAGVWKQATPWVKAGGVWE
jgi:hypothetical protein